MRLTVTHEIDLPADQADFLEKMVRLSGFWGQNMNYFRSKTAGIRKELARRGLITMSRRPVPLSEGGVPFRGGPTYLHGEATEYGRAVAAAIAAQTAAIEV